MHGSRQAVQVPDRNAVEMPSKLATWLQLAPIIIRTTFYAIVSLSHSFATVAAGGQNSELNMIYRDLSNIDDAEAGRIAI